MKITAMTKRVEKKIQEDQYEPFTSSCEVTATVDPDDDPAEVGKVLYETAKLEVDKDILRRGTELDMDSDLLDRVMSASPEKVEERIEEEKSDADGADDPPWA